MTWAIRLFELAIAQVELGDLRDRQRRTRRPGRETVSDTSRGWSKPEYSWTTGYARP